MGWVQNQTLCGDREIARVGFMSPDDTREFVQELEAQGLEYLNNGEAVDIVVADQQRGLAARCPWAEFGRIPWGGDGSKPVPAVRLVNSTSNELMTPDDWDFEGSLAQKFTFVESGRIPEYLDYLRTEDGLNVYRDIRTGKEVFIPQQRNT